MATVWVDLGPRGYAIEIGRGSLPSLGSAVGKLVPGRQMLLVADAHVAAHYLEPALASAKEAGFDAHQAIVPPGEATKCLRWASDLVDHLVRMRADRQAVVVALGGGVTGDLAGFAASLYARGISFVQVPTTLLAMVDASVGGKVAVDHPLAKNMLGSFHQPKLVWIDLETLTTLPPRDFQAGLAEVVKYGVILDPELFAYLEDNVARIRERDLACIEHLVACSCRLKADVVEVDEFETSGRRAILNYGHTFAHAFETAAGYHDLMHGEAVAIGMGAAALLAEALGLVDPGLRERQTRLLERLGLPTRIPRELLRQDLVSSMRNDKKAKAGALRFVLPRALGHVETVAVEDLARVERVLNDWAA